MTPLTHTLKNHSKKILNVALHNNLLDVVSDLAKKGGVPVLWLPAKKPLVRVTQPNYILTRDQIIKLSLHNKLKDTNRWSGTFLHDVNDGVAASYWGEAEAVSAEKIHYAVHQDPTQIKGYGSLPVLTKNGHVVLEPLAFMKDLVMHVETIRPVKMVDVRALLERASEYATLKRFGLEGLESLVLDPHDYAGGRSIATAIALANRAKWSKSRRVEDLFEGLTVQSARLSPMEKGDNVIFFEKPGIETLLPLEPKGVISVRNTNTDGKLTLRYAPLEPTGKKQQEIVQRSFKQHEEYWKTGDES
ncbi:hypothetical protein [Polyangium spumosum]|uniref:Uncharacterized protein n=1 Tax=Polyangium spumosum TaxID=889282 RepID=A0A6N7PUQ9_9BACT|nr:hypothetical protein [Polyangium spumosum]MRG92551.1 hypothetical protein [Polyangium spumosum]